MRRLTGRRRTITDAQIAAVLAWKPASELRVELGVSQSTWDFIRKGNRSSQPDWKIASILSWRTAKRVRREIGVRSSMWYAIRRGYQHKNPCPTLSAA